MQQQIEPNVVWRPLPGTSQEFALDTRCHHTLFTGSRGPGKSDTQLMRFRRRVGLGYGLFWRGIIFDREYKHLDDLVAKSKRWFYKFGDGAQWLGSTSSYKWVWPTGEELLFRVVKVMDDYNNYHGQEYPFIGWNELTKYPTPELYDMMMSCNRSSFTSEKDGPRDAEGNAQHFDSAQGQMVAGMIDPIPLEVFSTCNSYGPGHNWVKSRFIDVAPYGKVVKRTVDVFNPKTQQVEPITRSQVTIFGSYKENKYLDPVYVAGLDSLTDENLRKSWLEGDWDVVAGGALDDKWKKGIHIVPRFKIPATWYVDRSFDWGSTHPFSVGWWAEANGEEVELPYCRVCGKEAAYHAATYRGITEGNHAFEARIFRPAPGSLIQLWEWYGCVRIGENRGLKLGGAQVAIGIREQEIELLKLGYIQTQPWPGPADNQIRDVRESDIDTIEKKMADHGVRWQESDKSPGSRRNGLQLIRDRLQASIDGEEPALYFMDCCRGSIATIPVLPRDPDHPDDVDTAAEDHAYDMTRYRVLKGSNRWAKKVPVKWPH